MGAVRLGGIFVQSVIVEFGYPGKELAGWCECMRGETWRTYQSCVELGQPGLPIVIEDEDCVYHLVD
jgi:hypothetical protein